MARIYTKIVENIDDKYVKVSVESKRIKQPIFYKVQKESADSFCKEYSSFVNKTDLTTNAIFAGSIVLGTFLAGIFTKNLNKIPKMLLTIGCGLGIGTATAFINTPLAQKKQDAFLKKHNATYFDEENPNKETMADILKNDNPKI